MWRETCVTIREEEDGRGGWVGAGEGAEESEGDEEGDDVEVGR